jgi:trigger factor
LALVEGCKHSIEVSIPVDAIDAETAKVAGDFQKKMRMPGFRPGKAPLSLVKKNLESDIRSKVVENLIPRYLDKQFEQEQLKVVSRPDILDVHFTPGEPMVFKAEFEVAPQFELGEYRGLEVPYAEPVVTDADVQERLESMRQSRATYANVDPRPLEDGDFSLISLESTSGVEEPVKSDEMMLEIAGGDTMPAFTEGLRGASPGDERDVEVTYPDDYGSDKLAGKTVAFHIHVKGVRRKELPELNDEFAQDLGDYRTVDEVRETVRKNILSQREGEAQQQAKAKLIDKLVDAHDFPVPQIYVDRQIENRMSQRLAALANQGVDISKLKPDWTKLRESQGPEANREVRASLLLGKIADREGIHATNDEVDKQVEQVARQEREPIPRARKRLEENGGLGRIASHIVTEKTLNLLFEQARKVAEATPTPPAPQIP